MASEDIENTWKPRTFLLAVFAAIFFLTFTEWGVIVALVLAVLAYGSYKNGKPRKKDIAAPIVKPPSIPSEPEPVLSEAKRPVEKGAKFEIEYLDSQGYPTERLISVSSYENDRIYAFCYLRSEERTFKLEGIIKMIDKATGEIIENPWRHFGLSEDQDGREHLYSLCHPILVAIKALKSFSSQTRGLSQRERSKIIDFIQANSDTKGHTRTEIDEWLHGVGYDSWSEYGLENSDEYHNLLCCIPPKLKPLCRICAFKIAQGSGRTPIRQDFIDKINRDFPGEFAANLSQAIPLHTSKAQEIAELHKLLEQGALTQEEFDQEKRKILDK
ncbi:MAG: SHOCT domain-containing protein [Proteobacteria bacterium]|nr:SHOCT domain-containing protein [Pseudomonadota bacterium]MCL2306790.1 SHOCT domain-containing protein [Pseudomonadota bacterium]